MTYLLISNRNGLESKWRNGNRNKLFTLTIKIGIVMNCIITYIFILSENQNGLF